MLSMAICGLSAKTQQFNKLPVKCKIVKREEMGGDVNEG